MFSPPSPMADPAYLHTTNELQRARRLSKPRTVTSSSSSLTLKSASTENESDSSHSQATTPNARSDAITAMSSAECRSHRDSRQKIRAHLFGSSQDSLQADSEEDLEYKRGLVETARGVRDRLSRTGTTVSRRASLRMSMAPLSASQARLSLVPESALRDLEDTEQIVEQIKEKAFYDSLAAFNHVSSPIDEDMHVDAVASPIRRRSLFTPGLATRVPDDILRKPPLPQRVHSEADRNYYFNPSRPESSPLAMIAALGLPDTGRFSPVPRASTPTNLDYAHLGGLRLGTLRITNGSDSPVPRMRSPTTATCPSSSNLKCGDDYFSRPLKRHDSEKNNVEDVAEHCHLEGSGVDGVFDNQWHAKSRIQGDKISSERSTPLTKTTDLSKEFLLKDQARQLLYQEDKISASQKSCRGRPLSLQSPCTRDRTFSMAEEYRLRILDSPFLTREDWNPVSPSFIPTTKNNEFDDMLFDDDLAIVALPVSKGTVPDAVVSTVPDRGSPPAGVEPICASTSADKTYGTSPAEEYLSSSSDLTKADSGYDSNVSSKSFKRKLLPSRSRTDAVRPPIKSSMKPRATDIGSQAHVPLSARLSLLDIPITRDDVSGSSAPTSSETVPTLASSRGSQSSSSVRKLHKLRPLSQPPLATRIIVQSCRDIDQSNIPPVSSAIATRHAERLRQFPSLEHTFPSSHHTGQRSSTPSPLDPFIPIRFPSPAPAEAVGKDKGVRRTSFDMGFKVRGRRHSLLRRNTYSSSERDVDEDECGVPDEFSLADFGDVTASLGSSPYDIARSGFVVGQPTSRNGSMAHPHHMTTATPRVKVGMDEEQAILFARLRSQHRSQSLPRSDISFLENYSRTVPDDRQRPTSMITSISSAPPVPNLPSKTSVFSRHKFNDRGGVPGKMPRPKSINVPPMPPLPTPEQLQHKEASTRSVSVRNQITVTTQITTNFSSGQQKSSPKVTTKQACLPVKKSDPWEAQRQAWSDRRKYAIESLHTGRIATITPPNEPSMNSALAAQPVPVPQHTARPSHMQLTPPQSLPASKRGSMVSLKDDEMFSIEPRDLSGRYAGGLSFMYEPGYGLGGSAGTRNIRTCASRKSVEVSRGYGIDLSDVPIFVAPSS
ncbi:hypothetical protein MMC13_006690 [Lambiella insularis]|nr:hypothetical protein [Lambiella insularis]